MLGGHARCVEAGLERQPLFADDDGYEPALGAEQATRLGEGSEALLRPVDSDDDGGEAVEHVAHLPMGSVTMGLRIVGPEEGGACEDPPERPSVRSEPAVAAARIERITASETATGTW